MSGSEAKRAAVQRTQRGARYGTGTLIRRAGPKGDTWIAKWRDGGRQVQRGLGFVHSKAHPDGLTRADIADTVAQISRTYSDWPIRQNGSFLPFD